MPATPSSVRGSLPYARVKTRNFHPPPAPCNLPRSKDSRLRQTRPSSFRTASRPPVVRPYVLEMPAVGGHEPASPSLAASSQPSPSTVYTIRGAANFDGMAHGLRWRAAAPPARQTAPSVAPRADVVTLRAG